MNDIARGAGLSRTALYPDFRNKEDIYRKLVQFYYLEVEVALEDALKRVRDISETLRTAFQVSLPELMGRN